MIMTKTIDVMTHEVDVWFNVAVSAACAKCGDNNKQPNTKLEIERIFIFLSLCNDHNTLRFAETKHPFFCRLPSSYSAIRRIKKLRHEPEYAQDRKTVN